MITAGIRRGDEEGFDPVALDSIARELHAGILEGLTEGHHVVADESGHNVQLDRPGVAVRAVRDAVASLSGRARSVPDAPPP